jgi:SAM-dependent methyltransferase
MSDLEKQITEQYQRRGDSKIDYNSCYARYADEEREYKTKKILEKYFSNFSSLTFLEVGAGQGGNLPFFNNMGIKWENTYANELLPERVSALKKDFPNCHILPGNALEISLERTFDIVYQSTVFTSILKNEDRKKIADHIWKLVKPGGVLLWYDFAFNNPNNKDVRKVDKTELLHLFPSAVTKDIKKLTLAPPIGRRIGRLYPFLNWSILQTHLLAVFQKPGEK